jgi:hypothetical protein
MAANKLVFPDLIIIRPSLHPLGKGIRLQTGLFTTVLEAQRKLPKNLCLNPSRGIGVHSSARAI